jgi:hypothetical protein
MNVPAVAYRNYFLRCRGPKSCAIPLPPPSRAEIDGSLQTIKRDNRRAVFVCPYCGLVSAYYGQDIQEMPLQTPDPFQAGECNLASIEVECDGENCRLQKLVHTIAASVSGTWRPKVVPRDWRFSDSAICEAEHKLRFDESAGIHWVIRTDDPF